MKTILLAAGEGRRLRPVTETLPKCLVPINGKPLIDYWLDELCLEKRVNEIYINLHYLAEQVEKHIINNWSHSSKLTCWHESTLLGTAGTLLANAQVLKNSRLLVVHADNLSRFDLQQFLAAHDNRPAHCKITMMVFKTDSPSSCGIVELENDTVVAMHEKVKQPPGDLANGAVYIFEPSVLEWIEQHQASDISEQVIPAFLGKISPWENTNYHRDIGSPQSYQQAQIDALAWLS
jgi:mannose-1-phosphate guanylyltransferase